MILSPIRPWFAQLLVAVLAAATLSAQTFPTAGGYINDYVGVLDADRQLQLEALAAELQQKTGAEVALAVVRTLDGDSVENYANLLAEEWGVGDENDRGALLLLAVDDRQLRIEVGYGLEEIIPDGRAGEIRDNMTPYLRAGDYNSGITVGIGELASIIAGAAGVTLSGVPAPQRRTARRRNKLWPLLLLIPFLLLPRRRRVGHWNGPVTTAWMLGGLGAGLGGGRGGGGFSGGGGFGGFSGGGFGGGGASGGW